MTFNEPINAILPELPALILARDIQAVCALLDSLCKRLFYADSVSLIQNFDVHTCKFSSGKVQSENCGLCRAARGELVFIRDFSAAGFDGTELNLTEKPESVLIVPLPGLQPAAAISVAWSSVMSL